VRVNDGVAAVGGSVGVDFGAAVDVQIEGCVSLDGGLIELDVGDRVAGFVGERFSEAAIGADAEGAAALDAPSTGRGVGGVDVRGVGQNKRAGAELRHGVGAGDVELMVARRQRPQ
jgi:hypothetical protein